MELRGERMKKHEVKCWPVYFNDILGLVPGYCVFDLSHGSRIQIRKYRKIYRLNRQDLRNQARKRNYQKTRPDVRKARPWTDKEVSFLKNAENLYFFDIHISKILKRSVQAIQQKRYKLKKLSERV